MKQYKGRRNPRNGIAIILILTGLFLVFGAVGAIEHETITLKQGLLESVMGLSILVTGTMIGKEF